MALDPLLAEERAEAMLRAGMTPQDVEAALAWLGRTLPEGADLQTWIPAKEELAEVLSEAALADAHAAWYASEIVPRRFKRLLDAKPLEPDRA